MTLNKKDLRSWSLVFVFGFLLNFVWENAHSIFYFHPGGEEITEWMLLRASFFDALIILAIAFFIHKAPIYFRFKLLLIFLAGVGVAVGLELYSLEAGRWAYKELMPVIPVLKTGLTPTLQLGLLGVLSYSFAFKKFR